MKNMILGIFGGFMVIYIVALTLSIYSICVRKNEVENCLAASLESTMKRYYGNKMFTVGNFTQNCDVDNNYIEDELICDIETRLQSDSKVDITIYVCDLEKGIISAKVEETFELPVGIEKNISCTKTIVADRRVYE